MKIHYIPFPSKVAWGSDFMYDAIQKYGKYKIIKTPITKTPHLSNALLIIWNVQIIKHLGLYRRLFWERKFKEICKNNIVIGGIRGLGYRPLAKHLHIFDGIFINLDEKLRNEIDQIYHKAYHIIYPGEDPELFKPTKKPDKIILSWMGRETDKDKNFNLLNKLGYPYITAKKYSNYIPHHLMPCFYNNSSVYVNLSEHEGMGRGIIEASMCGLPVVTSNVGVASRIIDKNYIVNGSPREKIDEFIDIIDNLKDQDIRNHIGLKNRKKAIELFSWNKVIPSFDEMIEFYLNP
jgi:glycosyltransferase involved in cell wall biosynthesis